MKKLLPVLFLLLATMHVSFAQQRPQYSQYSLNNFLINPAVTGIENYTDVKMGLRKQWAGLEGAPSTFYTSVHASIGNEDRNRINGKGMMRGAAPRVKSKVNQNNKFHKARYHHGIGALAQVDKTGPLQNTTLNLTYAFHLPVSKQVTVALGTAGGINQFGINRSLVTTAQTNDPALMGDRLNSMGLDLGFGAWVYSSTFFGGVSAMQILSNEKANSRTDGPIKAGELEPHFYLTGGYRLDVTNDLSLVPSVMVKVANSSVAPDVSLKAIVAQRVWGGVTYRHEDAVSILAGVNISPLLDLGYAYDAITSELRHASSGSHEIVLGLKLQNRGKVICPQWMW